MGGSTVIIIIDSNAFGASSGGVCGVYIIIIVGLIEHIPQGALNIVEKPVKEINTEKIIV